MNSEVSETFKKYVKHHHTNILNTSHIDRDFFLCIVANIPIHYYNLRKKPLKKFRQNDHLNSLNSFEPQF
jgi:hypothetical protein